jgi:predicted acylesterase/phospholipase RssA
VQFTESEQAGAVIPGMPEARFWADSAADFRRVLPAEPGAWLILSTGGADGAFGAGLLNGWTQSGKRPDFTLVTGVSAGALIAPFAFAGPKYDEQLREAFTMVTAADVFEAGGKGESLLDTWPLKERIARLVTAPLVGDIAAEHRRGRRLLVLTTNLDAERFVVWDIGAVAAHGGERAIGLIRSVLLASSSVPGAFPPVLIEVEAGGRRFQEMHADGGMGAQFFVAPERLMDSTSGYKPPASDLYIVINTSLGRYFEVTERTTITVLGRAVSAAIKVAIRLLIDRTYAFARNSGVGFHLAHIDPSFDAPSRGVFDPDYMKALFDFGAARGRSLAFLREPPAYDKAPTTGGAMK